MANIDDIKFRAKSLSSNEWCYGELHLKSKRPHIHTDIANTEYINVNTVGRYSGMKDNAGKGIYEGDIIRILDWSFSHDGSSNLNKQMGVVKYKDGAFMVNDNLLSKWTQESLTLGKIKEKIAVILKDCELPNEDEFYKKYGYSVYRLFGCQVISNIYDIVKEF